MKVACFGQPAAAAAGVILILSAPSVWCQSSKLASQASGAVEQDALSHAVLTPFCMTQEEVTSHQGRDGLVIRLTTQIKTCRDSAGRTRTERSFIYHPPATATEPADIVGWNVFLLDPLAGKSMIWATLPVDQRRVMVSHFKPSLPHADVNLPLRPGKAGVTTDRTVP